VVVNTRPTLEREKKTSRLSTGVWFFVFFLQANGVVGIGGLNLFFFRYLE
jgi:hypothetical protein